MTDPADYCYDEAIRPDQYHYLVTHEWAARGVSTRVHIWSELHESISEEWIPADPAREWVLRKHPTGRRTWLRGSYNSARRHGVAETFAGAPEWERRACHGDYWGQGERRESGWQVPTPEFLAGLPRDPGLLLQRLHADSPHTNMPGRNRAGYVGPWVYALDALRTGLVPADLRKGLYRALQQLPGVRLAASATNLEGAPALALVLNLSPIRQEMLTDPRTGHYIGERQTEAGSHLALRHEPMPITDRAVRRAIVDHIDPPGEAAGARW